MSDSNRIKRPSARLVGLCLALALAGSMLAGGVLYGLGQQVRYDQEARNRSTDYAKHARSKIAHACVGVTSLNQPVCRKKVEAEYQLEKRDNERNELDLVAQRKSALWTAIMGIAALIGMGLSAIGVWLVWTTFRETRRAADAGFEANRIALNSQRAWVTLKAVPKLARAQGIEDLYLRIDIEARNTGSSAATHFEMASKVFFIGPSGKSSELAEPIGDQIEAWKAKHDASLNSVLMPQDTEVESIWETYEAKDVQWRDLMANSGPRVCFPMILAAVFYRTTSDPETVQLSWRSWFLHSIDVSGDVVSWVPKPRSEGLGSSKLCAEPHRMNLTHEEYPANDDNHHDGN